MCNAESEERRSSGRDVRVQVHGAIVVFSINRRHISGTMRVGVMARPMYMDCPSAMMVGGVVIGVRVDEWRGQGGSVDSQRQRDGDYLPDHCHILGEHGHGVKGSACGTIAAVSGCYSGRSPHAKESIVHANKTSDLSASRSRRRGRTTFMLTVRQGSWNARVVSLSRRSPVVLRGHQARRHDRPAFE